MSRVWSSAAQLPQRSSDHTKGSKGTDDALETTPLEDEEGDELGYTEDEQEEEEPKRQADPEPERRTNMILRRVLKSTITPLEKNQRSKLFTTRCMVDNKICDIIVDSGSCTNVVANLLIKKLNYPTHNHPLPYKLHWLDNNGSIEVDKQALMKQEPQLRK